MPPLLFDDWQILLRTAAIALMAYASLLLILRISGKRTLSKMNAFDFVVTVALGSTLATILLNKDVTLAQGALALALLTIFQFIITWGSVHIAWLRRVVTGEPSLLLHNGEYLPRSMQQARVTRDEIRAAIRAGGFERLEQVRAVVLETDGTFSVIPRARHDDAGGAGTSSLEGVEIPGRGRIGSGDGGRHIAE